MIHRLSDVQSTQIGEGTNIWQFSVVLKGARIGKNCNICAGVFIENDVVVGDDVTITVLGVKGNQVRIGVKAPKEVAVHREEILNRIEEAAAGDSGEE